MRHIYLLAGILFLVACTTEVHQVPEGPAGSWWLGGDDGGAFIDIKDDENTNDNLYSGTIYYDADNQIWYQGPFKLVGKLKFDINNHDQYLAWDGERLYLKEQSYLQALNPVPPL